MSALDLIPDAELVSEPATKPPTRWRNWWLVLRDCTSDCSVCGFVTHHREGDVMRGHCRTYPSKDVAQTHETELGVVRHLREYLGAFSEGECP